MRASGSPGRLRALLVLVLSVTPVAPASAQAIFGYAQGEFRRFEQIVRTRDANGLEREQRSVREFLQQSYEFRNQTQFRPGLQLYASFNLTDLNYRGLPDASRTPQGQLNLNHRMFALSALVRPTTTTSGFGPSGTTAPGDTSRRFTVTSRARQTMLTGSVFPENAPHFSVTWLRQQSFADVLGPGSSSTQANARVSYERGALRLYSLLGTLSSTPQSAGAGTTHQSTLGAGGTTTFSPARATTVGLQYDIASTRTQLPYYTGIRTRSQSGNLTSAYRPNRIVGADLNYNIRHAATLDRSGRSTTEHDGGLFVSLTPRRTLRITSGGGARTVRGLEGTDVIGFLTAIVAGDGQVRPGWFGAAHASRTVNWDPQRGRFTSDAVRAGSRVRLRQGLDVDVNAQVAANGDTAARDQRWTSGLDGRLTALPLRSFALTYASRVYRAGPSLARVTGLATSHQVDARWKPVHTLEMVGSLNETGTPLGSQPRVTTRMATVRWTPLQQWQMVGNWSSSEQDRVAGLAEQVRGRESAGLRISGAFGRRWAVNAGATVGDRGTSRETRQYDGSVTMTFGR